MDKAYELIAKFNKQKNDTLTGLLPMVLSSQEMANRIKCSIYPDGREIYSFDGQPFVEFFPPETYSKPAEDGSLTLGINMKFRTLNNSKTGKA